MSIRSLARAVATPVGSLALAIALVGGTGVATAASGGTFLLGRTNYASHPTALRNTGAGSALHLGTASANVPPLTVGTNKTRVPYLNSDLLDGLDSAALQRRITATCPGGAISAVGSTGGVTCVALPQKLRSIPAIAEGFPASVVLATFDGASLRLACRRDGGETPSATVGLYLNGSGIGNGHVTETVGETTETKGVGVTIPAAGDSAVLYAATAPFAGGGFRRASVTVMVESGGGKVTQVTAHVFLDLRSDAADARPCTVWATVV